MPLGIFNRRRKGSLIQPPREVETITLRVLVDSGPTARDMFVIRVPVDDHVGAIRNAIAAQIGIPSMCLFKVSIPWQAHYEASAYTSQFGETASLLSCFPGWNLDDPSQLAAAGGASFPVYISGSGSLRARRKGVSGLPSGVDVTIRHWFPEGAEKEEINIIVRTASTSSLDWARPASTPITLAVRFTEDRRRRSGLFPLPAREYHSASDTTLVDISPDASIAELKVALLLEAGRPAPAGLLDGLVLWQVDVTEAELEAIAATDGLSRGRKPSPYPPNSAPPLLLQDPNARVGDYFANFRSHRGNPSNINISAWVHPLAAEELAPRCSIPRFHYPMPAVMPPPVRIRSRPLPSVALDSPTPPSNDSRLMGFGGLYGPGISPTPNHRCCAGGHETVGLVGLGIIMSPAPSPAVSDHGSSDDEAFSWPPTPIVGMDDEATWLGPSPTAPSWGNDMDLELEHEQALTPKGFHQTTVPSSALGTNMLVL